MADHWLTGNASDYYKPAIAVLVVKATIEQILFSSNNAVRLITSRAASLGKVRILKHDIGWCCKIILFKDRCYSTSSLSSMTSVVMFQCWNYVDRFSTTHQLFYQDLFFVCCPSLVGRFSFRTFLFTCCCENFCLRIENIFC